MNFNEIITNQIEDAYPAAYEELRKQISMLSEQKKILAGRIIDLMRRDDAKKLVFVDNESVVKVITLQAGKKIPAIKDPENKIVNAGFDSYIFGSFDFNLSWAKCKELEKHGGKIKELINELFIEGEPILKIEEKKSEF